MFDYQGIDYGSIIDLGYTMATFENHSMGQSLEKYIEMKLQDIIFSDSIYRIHVMGNYDRSKGVSSKEKNDKVFNYKRPTVFVDNGVAIINCYPGMDYVYHYASLVKTYLTILEIKKQITVQFPTISEIENQLIKSNINEIPKCKTVILGYVQGFEYLSSTKNWLGTGDFLWKLITDDKILVGCKHSYWGDISGYIVAALARKGVKRVIYVGKLGTLNENYLPNEAIATGNKSIFIDGSSVEWNNVFKDFDYGIIKNGIHYTLPSIIQETTDWVLKNKNEISFVDPEIGHMAKSAMQNGIDYSYLHIISDNLSKKFSEDLSNERKDAVLIKRKKLIKTIGDCLINI